MRLVRLFGLIKIVGDIKVVQAIGVIRVIRVVWLAEAIESVKTNRLKILWLLQLYLSEIGRDKSYI